MCVFQAYYCKSQTGLDEIMEFYPYFYIWLYILGERMTSEQIKGIARSLGQKKKTASYADYNWSDLILHKVTTSIQFE